MGEVLVGVLNPTAKKHSESDQKEDEQTIEKQE